MTITARKLEALLKKSIVTFPNSTVLVAGETHPESGDQFMVSLRHRKGDFWVDGELVKGEARNIAAESGREFVVRIDATWKDAIRAVLAKLNHLESLGARRFCADQDEAFLRATGQISCD